MSIEIRPVGSNCNLKCEYCYEDEVRKLNSVPRWNLELIKESLLQAWQTGHEPFVLFGGEPLLLPEKELEELFAFGYEYCGSSAIQTNATLLNDRHIKMFRDYRVSVGVSIDGPDELNSLRFAGSIAQTLTPEMTRRSQQAITRLCDEKIPPGIIITLHRQNSTGKNLRKMKSWLESLDRMGITHVRLHLIDGVRHQKERYTLNHQEAIDALLFYESLQNSFASLRFDLFEEIERLLLGNDQNLSCVWQACDPYTTEAVNGIEPNGQSSICGRVATGGVEFVKGEISGYERYRALYHTPQEQGGCKGCRYFLLCKGHCPGTAIDGDWRNRSCHCEVWKSLFEFLEKKLIARKQNPITTSSILAK